MKTVIRFYFTIIILLFSRPVIAQWAQYDYQRPIKSITTGWQKIILPETMFEKLNPELSDLRIMGIVGHDTLEAPYILRSSAEIFNTVDIPFQLLNQTENTEGYFYTFQIKGDFNSDEIQLDFVQQNFDWKVKVEGSNDQKQWFTILDQYRIVAIHNAITDYTFSTLQFPEAKYSFFRLLIYANEKPGLSSAKVRQAVADKGLYNTYTTKTMAQQIGKESQLELYLKNKVPISRLEVKIANQYDYYRSFKLDYLIDSTKTQKGWIKNYRELASGTLSSLGTNLFQLNEVMASRLRLTIDNQDNSPLQVDNITISGVEKSLITRIEKEGQYFLVYGSSKATTPNYDIENFKDKIPVNNPSLELGSEQIIAHEVEAAAKPLFENKIWLWALMGLIIVVLGGFSFKMMRKPS